MTFCTELVISLFPSVFAPLLLFSLDYCMQRHHSQKQHNETRSTQEDGRLSGQAIDLAFIVNV